jgi:hypothetical protein
LVQKPKVNLDDKGVPRLPTFSGMSRPNLDEMKSLIRDFVNCHYRKSFVFIEIVIHMATEIRSGDNSASVPWGDIGQHQDEYISREYLPAGFQLRDPSKLTKQNATALLEFWYKRQDDKKVKTTLEFRGFKGKNGQVDKSPASNVGTLRWQRGSGSKPT